MSNIILAYRNRRIIGWLRELRKQDEDMIRAAYAARLQCPLCEIPVAIAGWMIEPEDLNWLYSVYGERIQGWEALLGNDNCDWNHE